MAEYRLWLPESRLRQPDLVAPVDDVVSSWASRWLATPSLRLSDRWKEAARDGDVVSGGKDEAIAAVRIAHGDGVEIGMAMLGIDPPKVDLGPADRGFLERLGNVARDDLERRLAGLQPKTAMARDDAVREIQVRRDTRILLTLQCDRQWLVALAKHKAPPQDKGTCLASRDSAISGQHVTLGASLGRIALEIGEFENLDVGDVLVFDQPATGPVGMVVDGLCMTDGQFELVEGGGEFMLRNWGDERRAD